MNIELLEKRARWARQKTLQMCLAAGKGHLGGAFSCTELLVALYYSRLFRLTPKSIKNKNRDRFIFSKGHACLALYAVLADCGFFNISELSIYGRNGTMLGGHPDHFIPGIEVSSGSLGHGLGIGCGLSLAAKMNHQDYLTIVLLGDGECNEGSVWEAAIFAKQQNLHNLITIIDNNKVSATDFTKNFMGDGMVEQRWQSLGWDVKKINGHNFKEILSVLRNIRTRNSKNPLAIIAKTIKGKGVSFMENDYHWHHGIPKGEQLIQAKKELGLEI